jgi:hypothetical protein
LLIEAENVYGKVFFGRIDHGRFTPSRTRISPPAACSRPAGDRHPWLQPGPCYQPGPGYGPAPAAAALSCFLCARTASSDALSTTSATE